MTLAQFVRKSAFRNRRRSLLTIASMAFSMLLLCLLMTIWRTFYDSQSAPDSALRLLTRHRVSLTVFLPGSYREKIRAIPGVVHVVPVIFYMGQWKDDRPENFFASIATDPAEYIDVAADKIVPPDQLRAWQRDRAGCLVDAHLAARHGWKLGDRIHLKGTYYPADVDLTIRAMYTLDPPNDALYFNLDYFGELVPYLKDRATVFMLRADSPASIPRISTAVDTMFHNSPNPTRTETEETFRLDYLAMLGNVKGFILLISGAVTFAIMLVTANTMAMSIRERTREVAVLRTLGFTSRSILALFLGESLTIGIVGGMIGVVWCAALIPLIGSASGVAVPFSIQLSTQTMVVALVAACLLGILSALVPSYHAARKNIVDGLRYLG